MALASSLPRIPTRNWNRGVQMGYMTLGSHWALWRRHMRWTKGRETTSDELILHSKSIQQWNRTETHHSQLPNTDRRNFRFGLHNELKISSCCDVGCQNQNDTASYTCCHCQTKKWRQLWLNAIKTSRLDRNYRQKCSRLQRTLLIRKGSIRYFILLLWVCLKISCISRTCGVWNYVCVDVW